MPRALWKLSWRESRALLLGLVLLMFGFHWVYVWIVSQVDTNLLSRFLNGMPELWKRMLPVGVEQAIRPEGRLAFGYEHPLVAFGCAAWAVTRGSDAVSGPLGRGTMEMVLAQPVRRGEVLFVNAATTTLGTFALCLCCWLGTVAGVKTVPAFAQISPVPYLATAANLFAVTFFLAGVTTLASAADRHRWRTIGIMGGVYVVGMFLKVIGRAAPALSWLEYGSFLSVFEPQRLIADPEHLWQKSLYYDFPLIGLGLAAYLGAWAIFARRDLPAPL